MKTGRDTRREVEERTRKEGRKEMNNMTAEITNRGCMTFYASKYESHIWIKRNQRQTAAIWSNIANTHEVKCTERPSRRPVQLQSVKVVQTHRSTPNMPGIDGHENLAIPRCASV